MKFSTKHSRSQMLKVSISKQSRQKSIAQREENLIRELVKASGNRVRNLLEQNESSHA